MSIQAGSGTRAGGVVRGRLLTGWGRWRWTPVAVACLLLLAVAPYTLAVYPLKVLTEILIYVILAMSLDLLFGYTGLASLGHALYFGVGGYTAGLLAVHFTESALVGLAAGLVAGAVSAVSTGWLAIRSRSVYFIMLTLAFSELAFSLATSWSSLTGGDQGLIGIPPASLPDGTRFNGVLNLPTFYYYVAIVAVVCYLLMRALVRSPFGLSLRGIRENEARMRSLGYPVFRYKLAAYVVAGAFAGLSGSLYVQYSDFVSPDYIGFQLSALVLVMVMVGGSGTLYGAVLGSAFVVVLRDELSAAFQQWEAVLGAVFILFVYFLPSGLAGLVRLLGRLVRGRVGRTGHGGTGSPGPRPADSRSATGSAASDVDRIAEVPR